MSYMYEKTDECANCGEEIGLVEGDYWEHTDSEMSRCLAEIFATPKGDN